MMERLFALVLASAVVLSQTAMASESEFKHDGAAKPAASFSGNLPLPPIPYLDTMPWIGLGADSKSPETGSLLMPALDAPAILKNSAFATNNVGNPERQSSGTAAK